MSPFKGQTGLKRILNAAGYSLDGLRAAFTGGEEKTARQAELEQIWAAFASEKYAAAKSKAEQALDLID